MDVQSALFADSDESGDEEKAEVPQPSPAKPIIRIANAAPVAANAAPMAANAAPMAANAAPMPGSPAALDAQHQQQLRQQQQEQQLRQQQQLRRQQQPQQPPQQQQRPPPQQQLEREHQPVRFNVSSQQQLQQQSPSQAQDAANQPVSPPQSQQQQQQRQRAAQAQGDLTQLLKDVCALLGHEQRNRFRRFVQQLKAQRDAGKIASLTKALLEQGPRVVGQTVWARAVEAQRQRRAGGSDQAARQRYQQALEQNRHHELQELRRQAGEHQRKDPGRPFLSPDNAALGSRQPQQRGDLELEPAKPGDSLADDVKRSADVAAILPEADALAGTSTTTQRLPASNFGDFLGAEAAWVRLRRGVQKSSNPRLAALGATPEKNVVRLETPRQNASRATTCLLLSRATWIFAKEALEALTVLARRRANDEAKRLAASQKTALDVKWQPPHAKIALHALRFQCEFRAAFLDAMLDYDVLKNGCDVEDDCATLGEAARLARKRDLVQLYASNPASAMPQARLGLADAHQTAKRLKADQARLRSADDARLVVAPVPAKKHVITKADVVHYLASIPRFNNLLFF
mmetsp:Transcript_7954/g.24566  ORF Transcript_7954/g.24566 Transcript_7954/m.24566 type:complete len:574 (+) Transcript_7954:56-1777(+)|eukprot:CAMPEP_0198644254 /NCGR_PEP_ID=MMETSP1467-20131203/499_1 /TAXON_ID=1462469 /ORGANISM="unid. sp., Strain CCMP2135" /LENGTH=573 /DNA_ID=CAMNT_0044379701 /DNA_START=50 /DNA_END=1771 /DNA_ORIENTATION=-